MRTLILPIHSFVDLITNSSSEVFVCATEKTISTIHDAVNHLLKLNSNSNLKSEDLFDIKLAIVDEDVYDEKTKNYHSETHLKGSDEFSDLEEYKAITLSVKPKIEDANIEAAAKILNTLKDTFEGVDKYN